MNPWSVAVPVATGLAAGIASWAGVYPTSQLFGPTLHHTSRPGAIALTFDDGPNPSVTPQLLSLLERRHVHATFFLVGKFARACPELTREIATRGHLIANHTETHPNLALLSGSRITEELQRCQISIAAALCTEPADGMWMRPPFGFRGPQLAGAVRRGRCRGVAMWSRNYYDWRQEPAERLIARLAHTAAKNPQTSASRRVNSGGQIILLHDGDFRFLGGERGHILPALEHWLPRWQDAGLEFVTMDEAA
jgi:peptidoglycan/xylan/chitin deacetylase (PgdA/CDA1 family)